MFIRRGDSKKSSRGYEILGITYGAEVPIYDFGNIPHLFT